MNKMLKDFENVEADHIFEPFGCGKRTVEKIRADLKIDDVIHRDDVETYFDNSKAHINLLIAHAIRSYVQKHEQSLILCYSKEHPLPLLKDHFNSIGLEYEIRHNGTTVIPRFSIYFKSIDKNNITNIEDYNQVCDIYRILEEKNQYSYGFFLPDDNRQLAHFYECFEDYNLIQFTGDLIKFIQLAERREAASTANNKKSEEIDKEFTPKPLETQKMSKGAKFVLASLTVSGFLMAIANS
tara:strand:- start:922 stop:1641 length:720 start_codon:yes stop_codon:yes gene_type:complete